MINHPLTILQRKPAFAKPGLIHWNPPVQVGEGTCQVQRRQPVLIRYQIREVSGSRRTGATLLFLSDPKPLPTNSSPRTQSSPHFISSTHSPPQPRLPQLPLNPNPSAPSTLPRQSRVRAALAALCAADPLPAINAVNQIVCLQLLWRVKSALQEASLTANTY